jgi:uncharacterized OsmC-like protein
MSTETKKVRLPKHLTPIGVAVFPRLKDPDFKFKKDHGEYSVKLRLPEAEARRIIALAEAVAEQSYRDKCAELAGQLDKKGKPIEVNKAEPSYEVELDDNKQPKGTIIISFKMSGGFTDKKTGEKVKKRCPIFDSVGQEITGKVDVWGGSQLRISYEIMPYWTEADKKAGASFRLLAVQVIKLVTKGSGDASMYGFGKEDGFSAAATDESGETTTEKTDAPAKPARDF